MPRLITEPASALKRDYRATVTLGGKSKIKAVLPNMTRMDAMVVIQNHLRANGFDREDRPTELFSITLESIKS